MKKLFLMYVVCCVFFAFSAQAKTPRIMHLHYDLRSEGQSIGDMKLSRRFSVEGHHEDMALMSKAHVKGWWGSWSLQTQSRISFQYLKPVRFDHKLTEDGMSFYVHGEVQGKDLWASASEIKTQQQLSDEEFAGTALSVLSSFVPPVGIALSIGAVLEGGNGKGANKIPLKSFVISPEQIPAFVQKRRYQFSDFKLSVLLTEELKVETYILNSQGKSELSLNGRKFACHKIKIKKPQGQSINWIAEDNGIPFLVKEKGKDQTGAYEIVLKKVKYE